MHAWHRTTRSPPLDLLLSRTAVPLSSRHLNSLLSPHLFLPPTARPSAALAGALHQPSSHTHGIHVDQSELATCPLRLSAPLGDRSLSRSSLRRLHSISSSSPDVFFTSHLLTSSPISSPVNLPPHPVLISSSLTPTPPTLGSIASKSKLAVAAYLPARFLTAIRASPFPAASPDDLRCTLLCRAALVAAAAQGEEKGRRECGEKWWRLVAGSGWSLQGGTGRRGQGGKAEQGRVGGGEGRNSRWGGGDEVQQSAWEQVLESQHHRHLLLAGAPPWMPFPLPSPPTTAHAAPPRPAAASSAAEGSARGGERGGNGEGVQVGGEWGEGGEGVGVGELVELLRALHGVYEESRLDALCRSSLPRLAALVWVLAAVLGAHDLCDHYQRHHPSLSLLARSFPPILSERALPPHPTLPSVVPCVFTWLARTVQYGPKHAAPWLAWMPPSLLSAAAQPMLDSAGQVAEKARHKPAVREEASGGGKAGTNKGGKGGAAGGESEGERVVTAAGGDGVAGLSERCVAAMVAAHMGRSDLQRLPLPSPCPFCRSAPSLATIASCFLPPRFPSFPDPLFPSIL
ncbi:unnamed protein product [Closterium sp. NIES-64]|nr:unnamed protein product [Closterium sp. NIES-64]